MAPGREARVGRRSDEYIFQHCRPAELCRPLGAYQEYTIAFRLPGSFAGFRMVRRREFSAIICIDFAGLRRLYLFFLPVSLNITVEQS